MGRGGIARKPPAGMVGVGVGMGGVVGVGDGGTVGRVGTKGVVDADAPMGGVIGAVPPPLPHPPAMRAAPAIVAAVPISGTATAACLPSRRILDDLCHKNIMRIFLLPANGWKSVRQMILHRIAPPSHSHLQIHGPYKSGRAASLRKLYTRNVSQGKAGRTINKAPRQYFQPGLFDGWRADYPRANASTFTLKGALVYVAPFTVKVTRAE